MMILGKVGQTLLMTEDLIRDSKNVEGGLFVFELFAYVTISAIPLAPIPKDL